MAKLNKTSDGLFFHEDFSEQTLLWTLSPSDANCLSFGDKGLQIKHTNHYTMYTIVEPSTEEYSCVVHLEHVPATMEDIAGILVMSNTKEYAECQSYIATGTSAMTNAEEIYADVQAMIAKILDDSYVQWSEDDGTTTIDDDTEDTSTTNDTTTENTTFVDVMYPYIKFTKLKYKYIFSASTDGNTWIDIGNVKFDDSGVIGLFVYGTNDAKIINNSHCYFKSFALYNSKYITIDGIDRTQEIEISDSRGVILMRTDDIQFAHMISRSNTRCLINTATLPTPIRNGRLRVYSKNNYADTIGEFDLGDEVYGGDGFTLERDIRLFIDNTEINPLELYDLGTFYRGSYFIKLDVHNNEDYPISNVKIKVIKYSEYYGGEEEVSVALHSEDKIESELVYDKEVVIDAIAPSEGRSIFVKLTDKPIQDFYMTANDYRFKIIIE